MREIKFKVWDPVKKEMIHNFSFDTGFLTDIPLQYTGFKDCDGKEIYEGDILRYETEGYPPGNYEVFFHDIFGAWWVRHKCNLCRDDLKLYQFIEEKGHIIEIIGNIHEKVKNENIS